MSKVIFNNIDDDNEAVISFNSDMWTEQADTFFHFLLAQGFILSEADLGKHFIEKSNEMGDLRSNIRRNVNSVTPQYNPNGVTLRR